MAKERAVVEVWLRGRAPATARAYCQDLVALARFRGRREAGAIGSGVELLMLEECEATIVLDGFRHYMATRGVAPTTARRRVAALASLLRAGRASGLRCGNVGALPRPRGVAPRTSGTVDDQTYRELLQEAARQWSAKAVRDLAILRLLRDVGLKAAEIANLEFSGLDRARWCIRRGRRETPLPTKTALALRVWLELRGASLGTVFVNFDRARKRRGGGLSAAGIRGIVKRLALRAGYSWITPRTLGGGGSILYEGSAVVGPEQPVGARCV